MAFFNCSHEGLLHYVQASLCFQSGRERTRDQCHDVNGATTTKMAAWRTFILHCWALYSLRVGRSCSVLRRGYHFGIPRGSHQLSGETLDLMCHFFITTRRKLIPHSHYKPKRSEANRSEAKRTVLQNPHHSH